MRGLRLVRARAFLLMALGLVCACAGDVRTSALERALDQPWPCNDDSDCRAGVCADRPEGKLCTATCAETSECRGRELCTLGRHTPSDTGAKLATLCLEATPGPLWLGDACANDGDCAAGVCEDGVCTTPCGACGAAQSCSPRRIVRNELEATVSLCFFELDLPAMHTGPLTNSVAEPFAVDILVPENTSAFVITARASMVGAPRFIGFVRVTDPDGTVLKDDDDATTDAMQTLSPLRGAASLMVPGAPRADQEPKPGTYAVEIGLFSEDAGGDFVLDTGTLDDVQVVFEPRGEEGGVLDLNIFATPGTGLTGLEDPYLGTLLATTAQAWSHELSLGALRYAALPAALDSMSTWSAIQDMMASHSRRGRYGAAFNLFVVDDISFTAGIAGGVPLAPGLASSPATGITLERASYSAEDAGTVLAHELGHALGLFHTSDAGNRFDPLDDTPTCANVGSPTSCPDYANLMFVRFPLDRSLALTEQQRAIARRHPSLYEQPRTALCPGKAAVFDLTNTGTTTTTLVGRAASLTPSCATHPDGAEAVHVLRFDPSDSPPSLRAVTWDFDGVVALYAADCTTELLCIETLADELTDVTLPPTTDGVYLIVVEKSAADATPGAFTLTL